MKASKRVAINTGAQYVRAMLNIVLSFLATRVILRELGVDDYGIYSLIAGVVSILSFITNSLVITTQRYLSVAQGEGDINKSKSIFNNSLILHLFIGVGVVLILEMLYPFLFNGFLNIPLLRIEAAETLYHLVVLILFLTFITSPFRAVLVSHENIIYITLIEILDSIFKLLIAYSLYYVTSDKLIIYGVLMVGIQIFNLITLSVYSFHKYEECILPGLKFLNKKYLMDLFSFAGWTMYNLICNLGRTQGISILLNRYMGPSINAAYGLGFQVSGALGNLSQSLMNAINPQLMKAEGAGNRERMIRLAEIESKFAFFLLSAVAIPCVFEMPRLLEIWLGDVPQFAVLFCRMVVLATLMDLLTVGLGTVNQAIGDIKAYTLIICSIKLSTLIIAIILLSLGYNIFYVAVSYVLIEFIGSICRLPFLKKTANLNVSQFVEKVFLRELFPIVILLLSCYFIVNYFVGPYRFIYTFCVSIFLYIIAIYKTGLCKDEKIVVDSYMKIISN